MLVLLSSGSNARGQLGNSSEEDSSTFQGCSFAGHPKGALPVGSLRVLDVASGANHTLLLLEITGGGRELWGCGDGSKGQLGLCYQQQMAAGHATTSFRKLVLSLEGANLIDYSFTFIAATWETSYVVLSCEGKKDVVISMGSNDYGDLGMGGLKTKGPSQDFHVVSFDHLPAFSAHFRVQSIQSGQRHLIIQVGNTLVGWGSSRHGQLGVFAPKPFASSPQIIPVPVTDDSIQSASLGIHHSVVTYASGLLSALGSDRKSQLQVVEKLPLHSSRIMSVGCTWNGTYVALESEDCWTIHSSGSNSHSQLGWASDAVSMEGKVAFPDTVDTRTTSVTLACGSEHVLALITPSQASDMPSAQIWGWGWNEHGNLGVGNADDIPAPTKIWPPPSSNESLFKIQGVWAGLGTSWICSEVPDDPYREDGCG